MHLGNDLLSTVSHRLVLSDVILPCGFQAVRKQMKFSWAEKVFRLHIEDSSSRGSRRDAQAQCPQPVDILRVGNSNSRRAGYGRQMSGIDYLARNEGKPCAEISVSGE